MNSSETIKLWEKCQLATEDQYDPDDAAWIWNQWAECLLITKKQLQKNQLWQIKHDHLGRVMGQNEETLSWLAHAKVDFSGFTFESPSTFPIHKFDNFIFPGEVDFSEAKFIGTTSFHNVTFFGYVTFESAQFSLKESPKYARGDHFCSATFFGYANFKKTTFLRDITFEQASFKKSVTFEEARFTSSNYASSSNFSHAKFLRSANFTKTRFLNFTDFSKVTFAKNPTFTDAIFAPEYFSWSHFESINLPQKINTKMLLQKARFVWGAISDKEKNMFVFDYDVISGQSYSITDHPISVDPAPYMVSLYY